MPRKSCIFSLRAMVSLSCKIKKTKVPSTLKLNLLKENRFYCILFVYVTIMRQLVVFGKQDQIAGCDFYRFEGTGEKHSKLFHLFKGRSIWKKKYIILFLTGKFLACREGVFFHSKHFIAIKIV